VVQVYVHRINDSNGPIKTLKGFQRVDVSAGKTGQVYISLPYSSFEFFDKASGKMLVSPGQYEVLYGTSSDAKDLKTRTITIQ